MIPLKSSREIAVMKKNGRRLAAILEEVLFSVQPGVSLSEIEDLATQLVVKKGCQASFKTVEGYRWTTCTNINQGVVHGIPSKYRLKGGDLLSVDMGLLAGGFHADMARTVWVKGKKSNFQKNFLKVGQRALEEAIRAAKPGNRVGHISQAIEKTVKKSGYHPIESLTGHGIGRQLHEEPAIPCLLKEVLEETPLLKEGMVLAIEVIYSQGKPDLKLGNDGWTIETVDGSLAALFEDMVALTSKKPIVLTAHS